MLARRTLAALVGAALAGSTSAGSALAADPDAVAPIQALNQALLASMRAGKATPFPQRFAALKPAVDRAFDLPTILQLAVGPRWASIPQAQQAQLLGVFSTFTVASYAANFDSFGGERLDVLPDGRSVGADQVVATQIAGSGTPHRLDYVMRRGPAGWRVVDVLLDGSISQTAVQRSDFRSLLASGGAEALIASLQRKVSDLSGGTLRS